MLKIKLTHFMTQWFKSMCLTEAEEQLGTASNNHLVALGSDGEGAMMFEQCAEQNRDFAHILRSIADVCNDAEEVEIVISSNHDDVRP